MEVLEKLLGVGIEPRHFNVVQVGLRALIMFIAALIIVRLGSKRFLARKTAFDFILAFMLGSMLSRAINGSAELFPTLVGGVVLVLVHRLFAILAFHSPAFGKLVKGTDEIFAGLEIHANLTSHGRIDLREQCRGDLHEGNATQVSRRDKTREIAHHAAAERDDE